LYCNSTQSISHDQIDTKAWDLTFDPLLYSEKCNIPRRAGLTLEDFIKDYQTTEPVIITDVTDNQLFRQLNERENLLKEYGSYIVKLSTANTHSYDKTRVLFRDYIKNMMEEQSLDRNGKDTLYHFGDNDLEEFAPLFDRYVKPPYPDSMLRGTISWGLGGSGTGVPFHTHGAVFAEVLHGMKRWFLLPPKSRPIFDPNESTLKWYSDIYTSQHDGTLQECVLRPKEILYLPHGWWHATMNLGQSVFISVFI